MAGLRGMSRETGKPLDGLAHLGQSVRDILSTPLGTRVMRRDYGSNLPDLVDRPMEPSLLVDIYAATVEALARWEPRLKVTRVSATAATAEGRMTIDLYGRYLPDGREISLEGIVL
jgi:uncharacterized protein